MLNGPQHVKISSITTRHIPFWCTFTITGIYTVAHRICTILFRIVFFCFVFSAYVISLFMWSTHPYHSGAYDCPTDRFCFFWDGNNFSHPVVYLVMELRWHQTSSFSHSLHCGSFTMDTYFIFIMFQNLIPGSHETCAVEQPLKYKTLCELISFQTVMVGKWGTTNWCILNDHPLNDDHMSTEKPLFQLMYSCLISIKSISKSNNDIIREFLRVTRLKNW